MLPALVESLAARRLELEGSPVLRKLADRLERFAAPLLMGEVFFPRHKALLSRDGGVCEVDGSRLIFDPRDPQRFLCPRCGREHTGIRHHRAWVWRYHLWLSERAIHLALLGALREDATLSERARMIIEGYAARYREYPNADNVLGPSRLFFSTYLEAIWLAQIVMAALLLRAGKPSSYAPLVGFDKMVNESASLIACFDEGRSNRQVWNNTALIAAGLWLGGVDSCVSRRKSERTFHKLLIHGLEGSHGVRPQLVSAVTDEGMWYEGENYHFFALRGFLFAAELLRLAGIDLYGDDGPRDRLHDMFLGPLRTVLPDLTLPARGDSPYGVSLLQPRFAELWEIGWARTGNSRLQALLTDLYATDAAVGEDPGYSEIAEQEQNRPAQSLGRELLGWKALWLMNVDAPEMKGGGWRVGSTLLPQAGIAVLRPDRDQYFSVECGGNAGGHGHPDLLHVTLFASGPLLMDFGTASYVSPSLHWYRSTLAHNAPSLSGEDQIVRDAWCAAIDQRGPWAWCRVVADDLFGDATRASRTLLVGPSCALDIVEIECREDVWVDLPIHLLDRDLSSMDELAMMLGAWVATEATAGTELQYEPSGDLVLKGTLHAAILRHRRGERLIVLKRLGPPSEQFADGAPASFLVRRAKGPGQWTHCYGLAQQLPLGIRGHKKSLILDYSDGTAETVTVGRDRCRVVDRNGMVYRLAGTRLKPEPMHRAQMRPRVIWCPRLDSQPPTEGWEQVVPKWAIIEMGAAHYRRSEKPYGTGRPFSARVAVLLIDTELCFAVVVTKKEVTFRSEGATDPRLDNETPDIHSDGVQCYLGAGVGRGWRGYLMVPVPESESVRVAAVAGTDAEVSDVTASWSRTPTGYSMLVNVDLGAVVERGTRIPVNLVVNEMYSGRERRAGQLALSGGGWVYLRGDRENPAEAVMAEVT